VFEFFQTTIIIVLMFFIYDKRDYVMFQTFLEYNQPADSSVAVLKWVDAFKVMMETDDVFKGNGVFL
jgi:hypothetical protein